MILELDDQITQAANLSPELIRVELAVSLFQRNVISFGIAAKLAGCDYASFQHILGARKIQIHYGENELMEDVETLKKLKL